MIGSRLYPALAALSARAYSNSGQEEDVMVCMLRRRDAPEIIRAAQFTKVCQDVLLPQCTQASPAVPRINRKRFRCRRKNPCPRVFPEKDVLSDKNGGVRRVLSHLQGMNNPAGEYDTKC